MPEGDLPHADASGAVARVAAKKRDWTLVPTPARIAYLEKIVLGVSAVAERWVSEGCRMKGLEPTSDAAGEEWVTGPWATIKNAQLLIHALRHDGAPRAPRMRRRASGQKVAQVFPLTLRDRLLFSGFRGEVWIEPGKPPTQGAIYRATDKGPGKVSLVLGGGNVSSIPAMDVLYKLFVENEVVVLKVNPVNAWVGPVLADVFKPLIDDGYLAIVHGGADVGARLAQDAEVDALHVTGSDRTYDAIVWGPPEDRARRKALGERQNARPFSAELGCVTPVLVVPGPWSLADLRFQARHVAGMVVQNASFNCNAGKVLTLAKHWLQRETFLRELRAALAGAAARKAYYPGARERWRAFMNAYPQAEVLGAAPSDDVVPWTFIPGVRPAVGEHALENEAFCGVLAETSLDTRDPAEFLEQATTFANERCWGTLSVTILIHPATMRDHAEAFDRALERLRYGGIGVNCWCAILYALGSTSWGAFPGHTPEDIRSGTGVAHNAFLFDHPQKSVVYAPFRIRPTPPWFPDKKGLRALGESMTALEARPSFGSLMRVFRAAF
jgi:acyl-CoA reductase-like NAD-dependent aldehyde dehydrogenase